jgi:MFS transporter, FSR family, fosmidomycin resistance protein
VIRMSGESATATAGPARLWPTVGLYGLTHAFVDACCAAILFAAVRDARLAGALVPLAFVLYDLGAFAIQPLLGLAGDHLADTRLAAAAGCAMVVAAMPLAFAPGGIWPAVLLAGVGNAVYHLGAGIVVLRATPGTAAAIGVFVAPGAAGLTAGTALAKAGLAVWPLAAVLAALAFVVVVVPALPRRVASARTAVPASRTMVAVLLVLLVVAARSATGAMVTLAWKSQPLLLAALTAGIVGGKALGGLLADRLGRVAIGAGALVVSLPLLMAGVASPAAGIAGMLAFNMTMPITLVAVSDTLGRPGFGFGLTCLALVTGVLPSVAGLAMPALGGAALTVTVLGSAALLAAALRLAEPARDAAPSRHPAVAEGSAS